MESAFITQDEIWSGQEELQPGCLKKKKKSEKKQLRLLTVKSLGHGKD